MKDFTKLLTYLCYLILSIQLIPLVGAEEHQPKKPGPDDVLNMLREGNERFYSGKATYPHADVARLALAGKEDQGKYAYATVIACSDSRVPVELIFDADIVVIS